MAKTEQTREELLQHLRDNIGFLEASCASFDAGFTGEAKRLATTIRVLLHDTKGSKSLLGLLGIKDSMAFITTADPYNPRNLLAHHGLVGIKLGTTSGDYFAPLGWGPPSRYQRPTCNFEIWWNELVISDKKGGNFTRRDLVLTLANKDGGAHVDSELDEKYADLTRNNSVGWEFTDGIERTALANIELHSVRQIAFELLSSLKSYDMPTA